MAFQEYTLADLRSALKLEFGLDSTEDSVVDRKINDAQKHILRQNNGIWPWLMKDLVVDVPVQKTGLADVTQDSPTVAYISGDAPASTATHREVIAFDTTQANLTDGFLIVDYTGTTITLDANYTDVTTSNIAYSVSRAYFQLPQDFGRMLSLYDTSLLYSRMTQVSIPKLESIRREQAIAIGTSMVYAVAKDPLVEADANFSDRLYLVVYPYPGARTTFRGKYLADVQDMTADGDTPLIPRNNREVLFWVAAWQLAAKYKESSQLEFYKTTADEQLTRMSREYDLAIDPTSSLDPFGFSIGPVRPPPGFPEWRLM